MTAPAGTSPGTDDRGLRVLAVVHPSNDVEPLVALLADAPRLHSRVLTTEGADLRLARAIRDGRPDVVVGAGRRAHALVLLAAMVAGARTVWVREERHRPSVIGTVLARLSDEVVAAPDPAPGPPGSTASQSDAFVAGLARAALLPGAGLDPARPVSIVIPAYNEGPAIEPVLSALVRQLRGADEIVVVDDGSTDDTVARAQAMAGLAPGRVRVLQELENRGAGAARNRGVREARHEIIAFTDAGCVPAPGWLEAVRRGFAEAAQPDLLAGVYEVTARSLFEHAVAAACYPSVREARFPDLHHRLYGRLLGRVFDGTRPAGRSMAVLRTAFDRVGGFRDGRAAAEDIDFARAVVESGGRWSLSAEMNVTWEQRPGWRSTARMYYRYGQGDGLSADPQAILRNLLRAAAYLVGPVLATRPGAARRAAWAAGLSYLSLPLRRAASSPAAPAVMALVPAVLVLKDVAKALGCLEGLLRRPRGSLPAPTPTQPPPDREEPR